MRRASGERPGFGERLAGAVSSGVLVLLLLLIGEMALAARAIELAHWGRGAVTLVPLGVAGVLLGFLVGRGRVPDLAAHVAALIGGLAATLALTTRQMFAPDHSFTGRVRLLLALIRDWLREALAGRAVDDDLVFIAAIGLLVWLIGYTAAWFLFRRGWFLPAIVLPGMLIVLNVTGGDEGDGAAMLLYMALALSLVAVQVSRLRAAGWQRAGIAFNTIAWRASAIGGAAIALLAVALVWSSPVEPPEEWLQAAADRLEGPVEAVESAWNELTQRLNVGRSGGSFANFDDSFEMGGALNLSDQPVAVLQADQPHYLAAQRYAVYTGRGWKSGDDTEIPAGESDAEPVLAPRVEFQPGQAAHLSNDVLGARELVDGSIRVLAPTGRPLLTIATYHSSSEAVSATLSWRQLSDERFDLVGVDIRDIPIELRNLAVLLVQATFVDRGGGYVASDPELERRLQREVASLQERYLSFRLQLDNEGRATALYVTGYLPNYDDIESVAPSSRVSEGDVYHVSGWQSQATVDELRAAPAIYPPYVSDRYLGLPESVTDETRALAAAVTQGATTVFDMALAIQEFLRATYPYDENIAGPARGEDAVHYFLFGEQRGYCEYFASAMVVMLRSLDIPARLVAGLMEVPYDAGAQGYLYREKQAHTWVEVYFEGYGWIPFEPTPARQTFDYPGSELREDLAPTPTPVPPTPTPEPTAALTEEPTPEAAPNVATTDDTGGSSRPWRWYGGIAGTLLATLGIALLARRNLAAGAMAAPGARLYRQLIKSGEKAGVRTAPTTTPRELAARIAQAAPAAGPPADAVAGLYRKEYYGGQALTDEERSIGERAARLIRRAVATRRFRRFGGRAKG